MKAVDKSMRYAVLLGIASVLFPTASGAIGSAVPLGDSDWIAFEAPSGSVAADPIAARLREKFDGTGPLLIAEVPFDRLDVDDLYRLSGYRLFWLERDGTPLPQAHSLIDLFGDAEADGLRPQDYAPGVLQTLFDGVDAADPASLVRADVALTAALLRYSEDIHIGRVAPERFRTADLDVDVDRPTFDRLTVGARLIRSEDPAAVLAALRPADPAYAVLRAALADARRDLAEQGWSAIPPGATLRIGDRDERVPSIRARLEASGDYRPQPTAALHSQPAPTDATPTGTDRADTGAVDAAVTEAAATESAASESAVAEAVNSTLYDETLATAVETFQARNNLVVDGVIGPATLGAMNRGPADRVAAIVGTMERLRWHPEPAEETRIEVNIASQQLRLYEAGDLVREMRVVVGRASRPTPLFSSALTWLEWNPTWTMPVSIAERDYLDRLQEDPTYLNRNGYTLYSSWSADRVPVDATRIDWSTVGRDIRSFMIRQSPGPNNALGKVKFMMANSFSVYLHDTPSRHLFNRDSRFYSSGCVRVQDPMWLAEYLLDGNAYWQQIRNGVLDSWQTARINLDAPMPTHLRYETAEVVPSGEVIVYPDVYGLDARLPALLDELRGSEARIADAS